MQGLPPRTGTAAPRAAGAAGPGERARAHYMRARVETDGDGARITPFERQDSALLSVLAEANALLVRPVGDAARPEGTEVDYIPL